MKKYFFLPVLALCMALMAFKGNNSTSDIKKAAPELTWVTDLNEAHKLSKESGKPIFGFFTGSDWCGWCMKLQRDVFAKDAFKEWASKNVILLELDFPRRKTLSPELQQQNANLQQAFKVMGYPTVWIFETVKDETTNNFNINAFGSLGYPSGATVGQEEVTFLNNANQILGNKK